MLERKRTLILEVRDGLASPESIALEEGREMDPTSVGTEGAWRVEGEGVLGVHAFVCFDGRVLYVQSATEGHPALIDGRTAPATWTEVSPPATITVGRVAIVFRSLSDDFDDETEANAPPRHDDAARVAALTPAAGRPARPFAPGAFAGNAGSDSERTRLQEGPRAPMAPARPQPRPAAGAVSPPVAPRAEVPMARPALPTPAPNDEPTRIEQPLPSRTPARSAPAPAPAPRPAAGVPAPAPAAGPIRAPMRSSPQPIDLPPPPPPAAPPPAPTGMPYVLAQWREASGPKKALVCLLPFALAAVFVIFRDEPPPPPRPKPKPTATSTATSSPGSLSASRPEPGAPPTSTSTSTKTSIPTGTPLPPSTVDGGPTLERAAVDAVANGAYGDAIRAYDQLAATYPDHTAYAEAARILRAKLDAGR